MNQWIVTYRSFSFEDWKTGVVKDFRREIEHSIDNFNRKMSILSTELDIRNGVSFFLLTNDLNLSLTISTNLRLTNYQGELPENIATEFGNSELIKLYRNDK